MVPLVGLLILGGAFIAASRTAPVEQPAESRVLDSLTADARLVTLPGMREVHLTRHSVCPRGEASSDVTGVDRDLRLQPNVSAATAEAEILSRYTRLGWARGSHELFGTLSKGTRSLDVTGSSNVRRALVVSVSSDADACA
jgi:hypothetical protein